MSTCDRSDQSEPPGHLPRRAGLSERIAYEGRILCIKPRPREVSLLVRAVGEWGDAERPAQTAIQYITDQGKLLRELGFSHCYWDDSGDVSQKAIFDALREAWRGE